MRSTLLLSSLMVLGLGACGEPSSEPDAAPEAVSATAAAPDERGTMGTAAPDGSGQPGRTLPTTAPSEADASANPAAPD